MALGRRVRAEVDATGVHLTAGEGRVFEVLFDDARVWGFTPEPADRDGPRWTVRWPDALKAYLEGTTRVVVREYHDPDHVVHDAEVAFGDGSGRVRVVDGRGRPLAMSKYGRLNRSFDSIAEETKAHYLDQVEEVLEVVRGCGLPAFVAWGTLLGAVRTGHLIGHDVDADLAWYSDHDAPVDVIRESFVIERALRAKGWSVRRENGAFLALFLRQADGSVRNMDVFGCWRTDDHLYLVHDARAQLPRSTILPLGTVRLEGRELPAPADPPALLAAQYGPSWEVPDPSFAFHPDDDLARRIEGWLGGLRQRRDAWGRVHAQTTRRTAPSEFAVWAQARDTSRGRLLELGCGDAADSFWFARDGRRVTAVDVVPALVNQVERRRKKADLASMDVRCLNLQDLRTALALGTELSREPRPTVYARGLLCDLPDAARDHLWRVARMALRDGGDLFLEVHTERTRLRGDGKAFVRCPGLSERELTGAAARFGARVVDQETVSDLDQPQRLRVQLRWRD